MDTNGRLAPETLVLQYTPDSVGRHHIWFL